MGRPTRGGSAKDPVPCYPYTAVSRYVRSFALPPGYPTQVYKGRRKHTGQTVALKFISKHGKSAKDIRNLRQEIAILRTLNHENIILMFDAFETDREFCVVTEYAQVMHLRL